jgi:hypothetical protein
MDMDFLVKQIRMPQQNLRLRQGEVVTLNSDYTIDVKIAGDSAVLPSVRYLSHFAPVVGYHVWIVVDNNDMLAIGHVGRVDKTLAPRAYRTTLQSITAGTETLVTFQAVNSDEWNCWDASPNPTRLTAPITGRYIAIAMVKWSQSGNDNDWFSNSILVNGTQEIAYGNTKKLRSHGQHNNITSPPITLTKGDYVELLAECSANADLIVTANGDSYVGYMPCLSLVYLGS